MKPDQLAGWALAVPRPAKRALAVAFDAALCLLTFWLALSLRLEHLATPSGNQWWAMAATVALALPLFVVNGFYRAIFRYAGWNAMLAVVRAVAVYGLLYALLFSAVGGCPDRWG
jgi:FlaA1/EpsC-like NDP-sugar epimerase